MIKRIETIFITLGIAMLFCSFALADRVTDAHKAKDDTVRAMFAAQKVPYPPDELFFRAFKYEQESDHGVVEMWARDSKMKEFKLIHTYEICYASGDPGPKRREGDSQVTEGFYKISGFNPGSSYHLSMRINYPNTSDIILSDRQHPGGDIFIHGSCVSIGCLAMTDDKIKEIYIIADDVRRHSGATIQFHIFPRRMNADGMSALAKIAGGDDDFLSFWQNLKTGYDIFEESRVPPAPRVDSKGKYLF